MSLISLIEIIRSEAGTLTLDAVTGKIFRVENTHATNPTTVSCMIGSVESRNVIVAAGRYMDLWNDGAEWKIMAEIDMNYDMLPLTGRADDPAQVSGKYIVYFKNDAPFYRKSDGTVVSINSGGYTREVGEIIFRPDYRAISGSFPFLCMAVPDFVLSQTKYPDFVPFLRGLKLEYNPMMVTNKSAFDVTGWSASSASNTATLTFADTTAEIKILNALSEDQQVQNSWTDWRTITISATIGTIPPGDYAIIGITPASRTVSFTVSAESGSGTGAWTVEFYPHRIPGSTATARHFAVQGRGFITVGDAEGEWIGGLRRRDRGQGHDHQFYCEEGYGSGTQVPSSRTYYGGGTSDHFIGAPVALLSYGTPRIGSTTDIRGMGIYPYIYVGQYIP